MAGQYDAFPEKTEHLISENQCYNNESHLALILQPLVAPSHRISNWNRGNYTLYNVSIHANFKFGLLMMGYWYRSVPG